jgi:glycosyltransferase involved in cell wall biosynthesis
MSTVSYLITTHNETTTLGKLLYAIGVNKHQDDEIVILDDFSDNPETQRLLQGYRIYQHALSKNYGSHKNAGIEKCSKNYIFQLDGDEMPPESLLGENLHALIDSNPSIEAYAVPRINDFKGITDEHAKQWGWNLSAATSIIHEKIIDNNSAEYRFLKNNGYILEESVI